MVSCLESKRTYVGYKDERGRITLNPRVIPNFMPVQKATCALKFILKRKKNCRMSLCLRHFNEIQDGHKSSLIFVAVTDYQNLCFWVRI